MLVAPNEPPAFRALGRISQLPERFGCDATFTVAGMRCGIQRKEVSDLRASVADGRLAKELGQMESAGLTRKLLIVEGRVAFTDDGTMLNTFGRDWTRAQWAGVLWGVQARGVWVHTTGSVHETVEAVRLFEKWCGKDRHGSLGSRPKPGSMWGGKPTDREWAIHMLQGIDGVGVELAGRIFDKAGRVPWRWEDGVDEKWLAGVEGIGKVKAARIHRALRPGE